MFNNNVYELTIINGTSEIKERAKFIIKCFVGEEPAETHDAGAVGLVFRGDTITYLKIGKTFKKYYKTIPQTVRMDLHRF